MSHSNNDKAHDRRAFLGKTSTLALGALGGLLGVGSARAEDKIGLARVRERGRLTVGIYNDLPPFHVKGQGIEIELAKALAGTLGVEVSLLPFPADDNMNDDLRNMVWKGHYLGYGPADVMLHVPVDRPLMQDNPRSASSAPTGASGSWSPAIWSSCLNWTPWSRCARCARQCRASRWPAG